MVKCPLGPYTLHLLNYFEIDEENLPSPFFKIATFLFLYAAEVFYLCELLTTSQVNTLSLIKFIPTNILRKLRELLQEYCIFVQQKGNMKYPVM